jgi:hypothetical protein
LRISHSDVFFVDSDPNQSFQFRNYSSALLPGE